MNAFSWGIPLLATQADMEKTVDALFDMIPANRKKQDAVVFMGHGTHHPSNAFYAALIFQVQQRDPLVFIGGVEGYPEIMPKMTWPAIKSKIFPFVCQKRPLLGLTASGRHEIVKRR